MRAWRAILGLCAMSLAPPAAAAPPRPKLVVVIAVDQFAAALHAQYRSTYTGGLKRLGEGVAFTGYQSHGATETCPGHSTILTGMHPAGTGIIANTWFDAASGSAVYCVAVRGTADPDARGPQNLKVDTFGDWLKAAQPGARVFAVSGKDRAAIMLGGHHADGVYWWKDQQGFVTSPYAGPAGPAVRAAATDFNAALRARWRATPPELWPADPGARCAALMTPHTFGKVGLSGRVPPEASVGVVRGIDFFTRADFVGQLRYAPISDRLALDFAGTLIDRNRLGRGPATDVLAVSLSTTDYIGHRYGNGGAEMCVQMAALDQALGAFLAKLDGLGVPYVVALTADHGGIDAPERRGDGARRVDTAALLADLNEAVEARFKLGFDTIVGSEDPEQAYINSGPDAALRSRIRAFAMDWLKTRPDVVAAYTADEIEAAVPAPGTPADRLSLVERFHESFDRARSGDISVAFPEGATLNMPRVAGDNVAGHGSLWDYDRRVPMLFWWPGVGADARRDVVETVDIAPTLAAITGIAVPRIDGRCLAAVAARCP